MPNSKTLIRAFAIISSSCSRPTAVNTGRCDNNWLWVWCYGPPRRLSRKSFRSCSDGCGQTPAAAVHNIKDRQSQVSHREVNRIRSCIGLDSLSIIRDVSPKAMPGKLL